MSVKGNLRRARRTFELGNSGLTLFDVNEFGRPKACLHCGAIFTHSTRAGQARMCSPICSSARRHAEQRARDARRAAVRAKFKIERFAQRSVACAVCKQTVPLERQVKNWRTCSVECHALRTPTYAPRSCAVCGTAFRKSMQFVTCSTECASQHRAKTRGKEGRLALRQTARWASLGLRCRDCGVAIERLAGRNMKTSLCQACKAKPSPKPKRQCATCDGVVSAWCRAAKFCSLCIGRNRKLRRLDALREKTVLARMHRPCAKCGHIIGNTIFQKQRLCDTCFEEGVRERRRARNKSRKAKQSGASTDLFGHKITLARLLQRDGGACRLCGKPTAHDAHYLSNDYPSIDHIVPVSQGGEHAWQNVQVAHRICNSLRRDKLDAPVQTAFGLTLWPLDTSSTIIVTPVAYEVALNGRPVKLGQQKYRGRLKAEAGR